MNNRSNEVQDYRGIEWCKKGNPYPQVYRELVQLRRNLSVLSRDAQTYAEEGFMDCANDWTRKFHTARAVRRERSDKGKLSGMYL